MDLICTLNRFINELLSPMFLRNYKLFRPSIFCDRCFVGRPKNYTTFLTILFDVFNFYSSVSRSPLFYQIPEILAYHEIFLEELRIRLEGWNKSKCIGDIFLETVSNFFFILPYRSPITLLFLLFLLLIMLTFVSVNGNNIVRQINFLYFEITLPSKFFVPLCKNLSEPYSFF